MDSAETITVLSLCAGYGGIESGLARALANPMRIVAVEVEAFALANLVAKAEEGKLAIEAMWPDLRDFPAERFRGCFDIVAAGYPCQPFSCAGLRKGTDDPRHLWPHIAAIIEAVRPVWFFGENVPGHLTIGFPEVYRSLRTMGYKVEAGLFSAAECGAPHRRQRLFFLAYNKNADRRSGKKRKQSSTKFGRHRFADIRTLANHSICRLQIREIQQRRQSTSEPICKLSDASEKKLQGAEQCPSPKQRQGTQWPVAEFSRWPARPGQQQYEWEEPRVVENTKRRCRRRQNGDTQRLQCEIQTARPGKRQTQSRLGGAINGTSCRVDSNKLEGLDNEKLLNLRETDNRKKQMEQEILQQQMLRQSNNEISARNKHKTETLPKKSKSRNLRKMSKPREYPETSSKSKQRYSRNTVPEMPQEDTSREWNLGQKEKNSIRIDRLRLLGNGVVPQQAEKAFRILRKKF